jgi:hypothetical protein
MCYMKQHSLYCTLKEIYVNYHFPTSESSHALYAHRCDRYSHLHQHLPEQTFQDSVTHSDNYINCNHQITKIWCFLHQHVGVISTSDTPRNFLFFFGGGGGFQQIQLSTEGRENGDVGAVAP